MSDRVIYTPGAAYGGNSYEARQRGDTVRIYHRAPGANNFRFARALTASQFDEWYSTIEHDATNPAHISRLANNFYRRGPA